jgi:hypothetical protein
MKRVMVRYRLKAERVAENERHVRAVFAELERARPPGLRYATFVQADGVSFVHIASIETERGDNPLAALASFQAFTARIADRCDEPPVSCELHEVGCYRLFSAAP